MSVAEGKNSVPCLPLNAREAGCEIPLQAGAVASRKNTSSRAGSMLAKPGVEVCGPVPVRTKSFGDGGLERKEGKTAVCRSHMLANRSW
eukprot:gene29387-5740_t